MEISISPLPLVIAIFGIAGALSAAEPNSSRIRIRFDADWRFKQDDFPKPGVDGGFAWSWQPAARSANGEFLLPTALPESSWKTAKIGEDVFDHRSGFAWYRTTLGAVPHGMSLHFEAVDDNATVFVNGKKVTTHRGWNDPFDVPLDGLTEPGRTTQVDVLVENEAGGGGISGAVSIEPTHPNFDLAPTHSSFSDASWRSVHLPHDYIVENPFDPNEDNSHGNHKLAAAWYRKTFVVPMTYAGKSVWLDFDGVYRASDVYLNGHKLGHWASGYAGFHYPIDSFLNVGGANTLAVRVDPRKAEGWWYEGGGIYRHVWLNVADPIHIPTYGTIVRPHVLTAEGDPNPSSDIEILNTVVNPKGKSNTRWYVMKIVGPDGKLVARSNYRIDFGNSTCRVLRDTIHLPGVKLWSIESPRLYRLITTLSADGHETDRAETTFGIRSIRFSKEQGFFLNGKNIKLQGTCNHQDHAGVGTAMPDGLLEWRIRKLKEMGSNAYRCSHNPPAAELLDACDRLGMVVMDETRHLGDTEQGKTAKGTPASDLSELKELVMRDRNHPSVIMWSLANEEPLQGSPDGVRIFNAMHKVVSELDPGRPVTAAMNGGWGHGISRVEDLMGFNYGVWAYESIRKEMPDATMYGSETSSALGTRGSYANDPANGFMSAYDVNAPGWGNTAEAAWKPIADRPWMAGGFVWTGFDYRGEPTPYSWPSVSSQFGILDTCGFPKDNYFYYKAWWGNQPTVHILPHWNWAGKEGQTIEVWVQGNADQVELLLNGKSIGSQPMTKQGHLAWKVPYLRGTLDAVGRTNGKVVAKDRIETTGEAFAIRLRTDKTSILADDEDLSEVMVDVVDRQGRVVPTADSPIIFSISGSGQIAGVGNGNPSSHEPDKASRRLAFNGHCAALIQAHGKPGPINLVAVSPGLKSASIRLRSQ